LSEPSPTYTTQGGQAVFFCEQCSKRIGSIVKIQDMEWLQIGDVAVRTLHGVCSNCGGEVHWTMSDRALAALLQKVLDLRTV
jgi:hypothetical protein